MAAHDSPRGESGKFLQASFHGGFTMILGLRTAIYPVSDLDKGKEWYARVFERQPYFDEPFYVGFSVGGFELGLIPDGNPGSSGVRAYWGVTDATAEVARLTGMGAELQEKLQDVGQGIRVAAVRDPFGNVLGIIENPHFDTKKVE